MLRSPTQETRVLVSAAGTTCDRARASELSQGAVGQQSASPLADARHGRRTNNITSTVKPNTALVEQQRQALSHLLLLQLPAEGREKAGLRCSWILPLDAKTTERQFLLVACCLVEQSWTVEVSGQLTKFSNTHTPSAASSGAGIGKADRGHPPPTRALVTDVVTVTSSLTIPS